LTVTYIGENRRNIYKIYLENSKGRDHLAETGIGGRTLEKLGVKTVNDSAV
jgi:hypothetical protein